MRDYMENHLPYLVHDGFDDTVSDFRSQIPILSDNMGTVVSILSEQPPNFIKGNFESRGLTGAPLKAKDKSIRGHINRFYKYLKHGSTKVLRNLAGSAFKVVNSLLGSLKEATAAALPMVGADIEAIKQI